MLEVLPKLVIVVELLRNAAVIPVPFCVLLLTMMLFLIFKVATVAVALVVWNKPDVPKLVPLLVAAN